MKTISRFFLIIMVYSTFGFAAQAQQASEQYTVTTQLQEAKGTYEQRKLYREFLIDAMKQCPYISNFKVTEQTPSLDNHDVVWRYAVNGWDNITDFYNWINVTIHSSKDATLKKALTPYAPDYALGGKIKVTARGKSDLVKQ